MKIAFFDFDGTITRKDSLEDFIQYVFGKPRYYLGLLLLSPLLVAYLAKLIPNDIAKQKLLAHFFKGWQVSKFNQVAEQYSKERISKIVRDKAQEKLNWHKRENHKIVIVSASIDAWLSAWCQSEGFDLISTKMESLDDKLTGKFANKNCQGEEKVLKINRRYDLSAYDYIYAYGDTSGDKPMLAIANESFYRPFE